MSCCGSKPRVSLIKTAAYRPIIDWHDRCTSSTPVRQIQWLFYRNGTFVYSTAYGVPTAPLSIGSGSTYSLLHATEAEIVTFLVGQGISIEGREIIEIRVRIKNCDKETALSNPIRFSAPAVMETCNCDFVTGYDTRQTGLTPVPPVTFTPVGGQLLFVNGLLTDGTLVDPLVNSDELMWLTLSGGCDDAFEVASATGFTGDVTVPSGFLAAVPNSTDWMVARNGVIQTGISYASGDITPSAPSDPNDIWVFAGLTGGDCAFLTESVSENYTGSSVNLPPGYSASNADRFIPVRNGVVMYAAAQSISGYTISGTVLIPETAFLNEEVWLISIS